MEKKELTCIDCPVGCTVTVTMQDGTVTDITGNTCPRGKSYAEKEVTAPTRVVTSTVCVAGGDRALVSVKTARDIPKDKIFACMQAINGIVAEAPVAIGDVLLENAAETGAAIVATGAVRRVTDAGEQTV